MKNTILTVVGFALMILGFLSLLLMGLGLRLSYLSFIDNLGNLAGFVVRLVMIMAGIIIIYMSRTSIKNS
ncbi:hypothetical protein [Portibacter lacus]|uniref:hypothetical protein n=1 Tax=Portibacter lacus TaxID=1099794 RepID=UPI001F182A6E|nr:hypothetical protein [Portibacter lacus]